MWFENKIILCLYSTSHGVERMRRMERAKALALVQYRLFFSSFSLSRLFGSHIRFYSRLNWTRDPHPRPWAGGPPEFAQLVIDFLISLNWIYVAVLPWELSMASIFLQWFLRLLQEQYMYSCRFVNSTPMLTLLATWTVRARNGGGRRRDLRYLLGL